MRAHHLLLLCLAALPALSVRADAGLYEWAALDDVVIDDAPSHSRELLLKKYGIAAVPGSYSPSPSPKASPSPSPPAPNPPTPPGVVFVTRVNFNFTFKADNCDSETVTAFKKSISEYVGLSEGSVVFKCEPARRRRLQVKSFKANVEITTSTQARGEAVAKKIELPTFASDLASSVNDILGDGAVSGVTKPVGVTVKPQKQKVKPPVAPVPLIGGGFPLVKKTSVVIKYRTSPTATGYQFVCNINKQPNKKVPAKNLKRRVLTSSVFTLSVSGLKPGTKYACTGTASNASGKSGKKGIIFTTKK